MKQSGNEFVEKHKMAKKFAEILEKQFDYKKRKEFLNAIFMRINEQSKKNSK